MDTNIDIFLQHSRERQNKLQELSVRDLDLDSKIGLYINSMYIMGTFNSDISFLVRRSKNQKIQDLNQTLKTLFAQKYWVSDDQIETIIRNSEKAEINNLDEIVESCINLSTEFCKRNYQMKLGSSLDILFSNIETLIKNSKTKKITNLGVIFEAYINLIHDLGINIGLNAHDESHDIKDFVNLLLKNCNHKASEKVKILELAIKFANEKKLGIISGILKSAHESETTKIPTPIGECIQQNKIQFFINADTDSQKDENGHYVIRIADVEKGITELWSKSLGDSREKYAKITQKFYQSIGEYIDAVENKSDKERVFDYMAGDKEMTLYKDSKYYQSFLDTIQYKKEIELDIGNNKKNKCIDVTKLMTRILKHAMKQDVSENLNYDDANAINGVIALPLH